MGFGLKKCSTDRLTSLPDELISHILSLLPTKDATVASLSLRKMRSALTWIRVLDFDNSPVSYCAANNPRFMECFQSFVMFVDYILQTFQSPHLSRFRLRVCGDVMITRRRVNQEPSIDGVGPVGCYVDLEYAKLNAWISFPLTRGVREIDLRIHVKEFEMLPSALFSCETLQVLKLDTNLDFELVSRMPSFRLTNLKALKLRLILIPRNDFVTRLPSNCPLVEELEMSCRWSYESLVTISSSSLKKLVLCVSREEDKSSFTEIDTPNLQYFEYEDFLSAHYSFTSMNGLVEASINVMNNLDSREALHSMLNLMEAVSNGQHLRLMSLEGLNQHFKYGSNLESLIEVKSEVRYFRRYRVIPSCGKSCLKRIVIKEYRGTGQEVELIRVLLKIALALEELLVICKGKVDKLSAENKLNKL